MITYKDIGKEVLVKGRVGRLDGLRNTLGKTIAVIKYYTNEYEAIEVNKVALYLPDIDAEIKHLMTVEMAHGD
jgi:hypothetical protein